MLRGIIRKAKKKEWWSEHVKSRFKSKQSQSNRFRITYLKGNYNFKFKFTLETSKLGVFRLSESRLKRLELMNELSNRGYSSTQITNFLNINGIRTIRTNEKYSYQ